AADAAGARRPFETTSHYAAGGPAGPSEPERECEPAFRVLDSAQVFAALQELREELEILEEDARPARDALERPFGDAHVELRLARDEVGQAAQQRTAAGQHDAAVDQVARQLGRRAIEHGLARGDDLLHRLHQRLAPVDRADHGAPRQTGQRIAAADLDLDLLVERHAAAGGDLEPLGGDLADQQVVLAADVLRDRVVEV